MTSFSILDNIEKIQEKFKLSFEYLWKYYGNGKTANAPFSIIFSNTWYVKGIIME